MPRPAVDRAAALYGNSGTGTALIRLAGTVSRGGPISIQPTPEDLSALEPDSRIRLGACCYLPLQIAVQLVGINPRARTLETWIGYLVPVLHALTARAGASDAAPSSYPHFPPWWNLARIASFCAASGGWNGPSSGIAQQVDPAQLIVQTAAAWPKAPIAVLVACRQSVTNMARRLRRLGLDCVEADGSRNPVRDCRVFVATFLAAGRCLCEPLHKYESQQLVFVPDALAAVAQTVRDYAWAPYSWSRVYGFVPADEKPSRYQRVCSPRCSDHWKSICRHTDIIAEVRAWFGAGSVAN